MLIALVFLILINIVDGQLFIPQSLKKFTQPPRIPITVSDIKIDSYLGKWYQMYASLIPNQTFERNGYCVTAEYYKLHNPYVAFGVTNSMRGGGPTGELRQAIGVAYDTREPGKFEVAFDGPPGDNWIIDIVSFSRGNLQYPWSIVSSPDGLYLFILARDPNEFRATYQNLVLRIVEERGFTADLNKPLPTYQEDDCIY